MDSTSIRSSFKQAGIPLIKKAHLDICQIRDLIYFLSENIGVNNTFPNGNDLNDEDLNQK